MILNLKTTKDILTYDFLLFVFISQNFDPFFKIKIPRCGSHFNGKNKDSMSSVSILHVEKWPRVNILHGYTFICITSNPLTIRIKYRNTSYNARKLDIYVKKRLFCLKNNSSFIFDLGHDPTRDFVYDVWIKYI
jgi:hypothetical protein